MLLLLGVLMIALGLIALMLADEIEPTLERVRKGPKSDRVTVVRDRVRVHRLAWRRMPGRHVKVAAF